MGQQLINKIPFLKNASQIVNLTKGFSYDEKYVIDNQFLLRIFSNKNLQQRQEEFNTLNILNDFSSAIPKAIEFGKVESSDKAYMILSYLPGMDGEVVLKELTNEEQFRAGVLAGKELIKLHHLAAPSDYPSWYEVKKQKSDRYLIELRNIDVGNHLKDLLETYILENEFLLKGRPNTFQHDDFHPVNIIIHNRSFAGIIDFGRMDWGDPIHDLHKLGFFSKPVSIPFTNGIIAGYHDEQRISTSFWELYTLYSAMHVVSSLVWGLKISQEQFEKMLEFSLNVIEDHDEFSSIIPKWYKSYA